MFDTYVGDLDALFEQQGVEQTAYVYTIYIEVDARTDGVFVVAGLTVIGKMQVFYAGSAAEEAQVDVAARCFAARQLTQGVVYFRLYQFRDDHVCA